MTDEDTLMYRIGLTGNIASGKTVAANRLKELGARVICADTVAREAVLPRSEGARRIREAFGAGVFSPDGSLDRAALGRIVFRDEGSRRRLEAILHPLILQNIHDMLQAWERETPNAVAVVDAALLIETGLHETMDEVWLVTASDKVRLQRIMNRDGLSAKHALERMASQMPQKEKERFADHILNNDSTRRNLLALVDDLWTRKTARITGE